MYIIKTEKGYIKGSVRSGFSFTTIAHARHFDRIELLSKFDSIAVDLKDHYGCEDVEAVKHGEEVRV
ncbi:hypothetical protein [Metabacillus arenae]|uniref:Uncharacterized protein n=1 Tax=Metabacillus arenae TaxID=2771434 RepID=A0A926NJR7_9BACI|nr:hypothetical protein [Metabacillus arenae]MBD1379131.1 hypothetical protein [Metabacillus arenae]